jgi:hypothetical protein
MKTRSAATVCPTAAVNLLLLPRRLLFAPVGVGEDEGRRALVSLLAMVVLMKQVVGGEGFSSKRYFFLARTFD